MVICLYNANDTEVRNGFGVAICNGIYKMRYAVFL